MTKENQEKTDQRRDSELIQPTGSDHQHYIGVCGKAYRVRVLGGMRQVSVDGEWISHSQFVDKLYKAQNWDALYELAIGACLLNPEAVKGFLSQNTPISPSHEI